MQFQPPVTATTHPHHLPHPVTVVTGLRKPLDLDSVKTQHSSGHSSNRTYPSSSMSIPPSPPTSYVTSSVPSESHAGQSADPHVAPRPAFGRLEIRSSSSVSSGRENVPAPSLPLQTPGTYQPSSPYSLTPRLPAVSQVTAPERNYFPQRAAIPFSTQPLGLQISEFGRTTGPLRLGRSSRRGKTHVQKACVNCKKAHLSCDAQRPCARCIASGKQGTCHDVEHKKRGRPRLRDDREARTGREIAPTDQAPTPAPPTASTSTPLLPLMTNYSAAPPPPHRRTQSGRVLRSHRPSVGAQSQPIALQRHTIGTPGSAAARSMPTARVFTNLSFRILRANKTFVEQFAHNSEVRGREIHVFVEPRHEQDLQRLGTDLRNERERRDPMALPTIFSDQEQQAIDSIDENRVGDYVHGSRERQETWYFNGTHGSMHRPMIVQLGQVGMFPFVLFSMPHPGAMDVVPPMPDFNSASFSSTSPRWDQGYATSPGGFGQPGSGSTTPSMSLQSLAATLPPGSTTVGASSYVVSPRYPSGSSDFLPIQGASGTSNRNSIQSVGTSYSQTPYYGASGNSSTRPQSTASEPFGIGRVPSGTRRPSTFHGQARSFGAMRDETEPPVPSLPIMGATLPSPSKDSESEDARKRRRLNINELTN